MKNTIISIVVIIIVIVAGVLLFNKSSTQTGKPLQNPDIGMIGTTTTTDNTNATSTTSASSTAATFTVDEVAKHNNATSCYSIIRDSVYDLTKWISQHPGGEGAILSICGKDGTQAFLDQHHGAARQEQILATFKIGTVAR